MNVYTVKDLVAKTYIPPFTMKTDRDAIEGFRLVTNDEGTPYNKHPEDYVLFKIATYDERTGKVTSMEENEQLIVAKELYKGGN